MADKKIGLSRDFKITTDATELGYKMINDHILNLTIDINRKKVEIIAQFIEKLGYKNIEDLEANGYKLEIEDVRNSSDLSKNKLIFKLYKAIPEFEVEFEVDFEIKHT
jgi:hypothetical protein